MSLKAAGYTEEQTLAIIECVCNKFLHYTFGIYDRDDIHQESFLLCVDALERYDGGAPLENFLTVHVRNRLLTLKRNKYKPGSVKFLLNHCIPIEGVDDTNETSMRYEDDVLKVMENQELLDRINDALPVEQRMDFLRLIKGVKISKTRQGKIMEIISQVLQESGYEDGDL